MKAMRRLQSSENCTITNNGITRTGTSTVPKKKKVLLLLINVRGDFLEMKNNVLHY